MHICDLETDGLVQECSKIWINISYDTEGDLYYFSFHSDVIDEYGFEILTDIAKQMCDEPVILPNLSDHFKLLGTERTCYHNFGQFDRLVIRKLVDPDWEPGTFECTYILSQLMNPDRGLHSIKAWGQRVGLGKVQHDEWDRFSPEMVSRCFYDVQIGTKTWYKLQEEKKSWEDKGQSWDQAISIEYGIAKLQGEQERHGVLFDEDKAYDLAEEIWNEVFKVSDQLSADMPLRLLREKARANYEDEPFTKAGNLASNVVKWFGEGQDISGPFTRIRYEDINLNSPAQVKDFLLSQGWIPDQWTDKGSPQVTESSYPSIKGELGQLVSKRAVLKHRAQMLFNITKKGELKGLINLVRDDGRIEAGAMTNGTNTGRMTHRGLVNIPKPKDLGLWPSDVQIRELFIVPDGTLMMGVDADGLEARMEAHSCKPYEGGEEYASALIDGDVHSNTAFNNGYMNEEELVFYQRHKVDKVPLAKEDEHRYKILDAIREESKAPKYAITYGSGIPGLAKTLGCSIAKSTKIYNDFWNGNTALNGFKKAIVAFWKSTGKQYIIGIDGRRVNIRSEHSIVNAYFQSTGSIVVKVAALYFDRWLREREMITQQIIIYHDELEGEVPIEEKDVVEELAKEAFEEAGKFLKIRVPVTGTPKWGVNWKQVH